MALIANSTYAYVDLNDVQVFVGTDDLIDRGDWSNSASYDVGQVTLYLGALYFCLTANTATPPAGNVSEEWSTLALVRQSNPTSEFIINGTRVIRDFHIAWGTNPNNNEVSAVDMPYQGVYPNVQAAIDAIFASTGTTGTQVIAQQGSAFAYNLYLAGTNYTNSVTQVEVVNRENADLAEAAARVFGDGTVAQQGSNYAFQSYVAGTNFALSLSQTGAGTLIAQNGSQFSVMLRDQGTNYTDSQIAIAVQNGSQFNEIIHDQGTNYTDSRFGVAVQTGSQFSISLRDQGTNYTNSQVAIEVINRTNGDAVVAQQGSNYTFQSYVAGTNYALSLSQAGAGTAIAQNGSQFTVILRDQGTNYTNSQIAIEVVNRTNGDAVVAQQGSNFAYNQYIVGTNYASSLVTGASGSQFTVILRDQGTNYTNSQVAVALQNGSQFTVINRDQGTNYTNTQVIIEAASRTAADLLVERHGSELAFDLYWQGTNNTTNVQLSDAGVTNDGAGLSTARVGSNLPVKRIKAGTNISIENNGTNIKVGIDTVNTTQTSWVGPSVGQAGVAAYAGTVFMDFGSQAYSTITLAGNLYIIPTGMQAGRGVSARLIGDTVDRSLDFAGGVRFIGSRPTTLAANKIAVVSFSSYSNDLSNVVGAYSAET